MGVFSAVHGSLNGIQRYVERLERSADRVAREAPDPVSTAEALVEQSTSANGVKASVAVIKTADEMIGTLLDVVG